MSDITAIETANIVKIAEKIANEQRGRTAALKLLANTDTRSMAYFTYWLTDAIAAGFIDAERSDLRPTNLVVGMLRYKLAEYEEQGF